MFKSLVSCLSIYIHDPKFYKNVYHVSDHVCILSLACYLVFFLISKHIYKNSKFCCCFSVSGETGRPARSTGDSTGHARLCMSVGRPSGSTDWKQCCSRVFWVDRQVDRLQKTVFSFRGRSTGRSTQAQRLLPAGRTADRTGRPLGLQSSNGSFLFCVFLKSVFVICFGRLFLSFWRSFPDQISLK